jgi:hypothetical protein
MYYVIRPFTKMSEAMAFCNSGSSDTIVTDEDGTILMKHQELPIEDIYGLMIAKTFLEDQCSNGLEKS